MKSGKRVVLAALAVMPAVLLVVVVMLSPAAAVAAAPQSGTVAAAGGEEARASEAAAGARFDADAATAGYMAQLSPAARARSDAYFEGGYWLQLWDFVVGLAVAWLFLGTGLAARIRDRLERITPRMWLQTLMFALLFVLISEVTLPWEIYKDYFREHQYGMSNQTFAAYLAEWAKGLGIGLIGVSIAAVAIYAVLRKAPRTWWLWGALVAIAFAMFGAAIAPVYLEPVFNHFQPLPESVLKEQILSMARANGIPATDVYQFDASKQTTKMSAHVSGFLGTTQISLNDNLLHRGSQEEIRGVVGHEMGHYVLHHVYKGMLAMGVVIVIAFAFLRWSFDKLQVRYGERWGIRGVSDLAGMPLLVVLLSAFFLVLTPVNNTITRTMEAEADNYGLNVARQPDGFAQAALHLSEYRKMEPGPVEEFVFFDHPSGWHRIHRAMVWKAEHVHDADIVAYDATHQVPGVARREGD